MSDSDDFWGEPIHSYSRAQALEDGMLVAVPEELQKNAGIKWPIAMTSAVYEQCCAWEEGDTERTGQPQDVTGRMWDVVWMFRLAMRRAEGDRCNFALHVVDRHQFREGDKIDSLKWRVELKALVGPGDTPEPVITIMLPNED